LENETLSQPIYQIFNLFQFEKINLIILFAAIFHLSANSQAVKCAELYCPNFNMAKPYKILKLPNDVPYSGLYEIMKFASDKFKSPRQAIAVESYYSGEIRRIERLTRSCKFLYKLRISTIPDRIGCFPEHIYIDNVASKLNYSIVYKPRINVMSIIPLHVQEREYLNYSAIDLSGTRSWWYFLDPTTSLFTQLL